MLCVMYIKFPHQNFMGVLCTSLNHLQLENFFFNCLSYGWKLLGVHRLLNCPAECWPRWYSGIMVALFHCGTRNILYLDKSQFHSWNNLIWELVFTAILVSVHLVLYSFLCTQLCTRMDWCMESFDLYAFPYCLCYLTGWNSSFWKGTFTAHEDLRASS